MIVWCRLNCCGGCCVKILCLLKGCFLCLIFSNWFMLVV